jgi:hypothetical protein
VAANAEGVGRRYLEKLVQIELALPPPRESDMQALLRGDRPDTTITIRQVSADAAAEEQSAEAGTGIERPHGAGDGLTSTKHAINAVGAASVGVALVAALLGLAGTPFTVAAVAVGALAGAAGIVREVVERARAAAAERERGAVADEIRRSVAEGVSQDELEERVVRMLGREGIDEDVARKGVQSYLLDAADELTDVEETILRYPPGLPRGAKRMLNHARLLTRIARDRGIFGGSPRIDPVHLGEWIALSERWPEVAACVSRDPDVMTELEAAAREDRTDAALARLGIRVDGQAQLATLLASAPDLGSVVRRLIHFEPSWTSEASSQRGC